MLPTVLGTCKKRRTAVVVIMENQSSDVEEWVCCTKAKMCAGQDPCYFNDERERCLRGFKIKVKKVGVF